MEEPAPSRRLTPPRQMCPFRCRDRERTIHPWWPPSPHAAGKRKGGGFGIHPCRDRCRSRRVPCRAGTFVCETRDYGFLIAASQLIRLDGCYAAIFVAEHGPCFGNAVFGRGRHMLTTMYLSASLRTTRQAQDLRTILRRVCELKRVGGIQPGNLQGLLIDPAQASAGRASPNGRLHAMCPHETSSPPVDVAGVRIPPAGRMVRTV